PSPSSYLVRRPTPSSTLFPYTTLFRSGMAGIKTGFDYGMGNRGYTATITEEQQQANMASEDGKVAKLAAVPAKDLTDLIQQMSDQMHQAAIDLNFELAARLRDEVHELKKELRDMQREGHA